MSPLGPGPTSTLDPGLVQVFLRKGDLCAVLSGRITPVDRVLIKGVFVFLWLPGPTQHNKAIC